MSVGLDIGSRTVHIAQVSLGRDGGTVTNFGGVALPPGAVREGEVIDSTQVGQTIKELVYATKLRDKKVHVGIANQRVVVRQIDLPWLPQNELRESLAFQVQEFIPIPVEDAQLDFHILEEFEAENEARMVRLLLVAAHRDMVTAHLEAVQAAGLRPASVDLNPFAILRALGSSSMLATGPEVLVDVGAGVTDIVVHERGLPRFVRILVLGGDDITDAIASGLGIDHEAAEALKLATDVTGRGPDETAGRLVAEHARTFVDEVRNSLDYYRTQTHTTEPLSRLVITGGGSLMPGLTQALSSATGLVVESGNPFNRFRPKASHYAEDQLAQVGPTLATAIGLALGGAE